MKVRKRRGQLEIFNPEKVVDSIKKVVDLDKSSEDIIWNIAYQIEKDLEDLKSPTTEDVAKSLVSLMRKSGLSSEARKYDNYRNKIASDRIKDLEKTVLEITSGQNDEWNKENSNKNARLLTTQRDYIAGAVGKSISANYIVPKDVLDAHNRGAIHIHDLDYLAEEARTNCELINLEDMLQNGTVINGVMIERPKRFITACTIATQIITGVTSATYGGATITLSHLAPFVDSSRQIHKKKYQGLGLSEEKINELAEKDTLKEINDGVQTFNYQILSMSSTNGQSPFITTFMYLNEVPEGQLRKDLSLIIEEMLRQRIQGLKNSYGSYIAPAFPKLILCLDSTIVDKDSPYHYLLELSAECTSKRLVPDYISEKIMKELKINAKGTGDVYPAMGCRSFLTPDRVFENIANAKNFDPDKGKYYGRFNIGVSTLNLPYIALEARRLSEENNEDIIDVFYERLEYYAELCHKMQRIRAERLMETKAEVAPLLWCHGALARLEPNDTLRRLIIGGYSTSSLGYSGLYETVKILTGENHYESGIGHEIGIAIMEKLNEFTNKWKQEENIDYSLYGTPMESGTYKFAKACRREFGEDVFRKLDGHDRFFITNSIHIPVFEDIDAFEKLSIESEYQNLSPGGNIIYIETCDLSKNPEAIIQVLEHIYNNCMYAEINTTVSTCNSCGANNTIEVVGIGEDMHVECTNCGQRDEGNGELSYAIRVCGYISTNSFNAGRAGDIQSRVKHIDNKDWREDGQIYGD